MAYSDAYYAIRERQIPAGGRAAIDLHRDIRGKAEQLLYNPGLFGQVDTQFTHVQ
jgi:hypothetical protein